MNERPDALRGNFFEPAYHRICQEVCTMGGHSKGVGIDPPGHEESLLLKTQT
jgi:hypothetical protein